MSTLILLHRGCAVTIPPSVKFGPHQIPSLPDLLRRVSVQCEEAFGHRLKDVEKKSKKNCTQHAIWGGDRPVRSSNSLCNSFSFSLGCQKPAATRGYGTRLTCSHVRMFRFLAVPSKAFDFSSWLYGIRNDVDTAFRRTFFHS